MSHHSHGHNASVSEMVLDRDIVTDHLTGSDIRITLATVPSRRFRTVHIMYSCLCTLCTFCPCLLLHIHSILLYFYSSIQLCGCKCVNKLSSVQFSSEPATL